MKVYVENDDIPKRCAECRFCYYNEDEYLHCCRINGIDIENKKCWRETHPECPLLSLSDYTKQVRKEVCEEIRQNAISHNNLEVDMYYVTPQQLYEIEQGETECQKN